MRLKISLTSSMGFLPSSFSAYEPSHLTLQALDRTPQFWQPRQKRHHSQPLLMGLRFQTRGKQSARRNRAGDAGLRTNLGFVTDLHVIHDANLAGQDNLIANLCAPRNT